MNARIEHAQALWQTVQDHLDRRRDPLDDPAVQDFLLEHPEHLPAVASLRAHLGALVAAQPAPAPAENTRRLRVASIGAALGLTAALCWWQLVGFETRPAEPDVVLPDTLSGDLVLRCEVRSYTLDESGVHERQVSTGTFSVLEADTRRLETTSAGNGHPIRAAVARIESRVRPELLEQTP